LASRSWVAGIEGGVLAAFNSRNILFAFLSLEVSIFSSEAGGKTFRAGNRVLMGFNIPLYIRCFE
jgi:hypothetical protein